MLGVGHLLGLVFHLIIGDDTPSLNSTSNASLFRKPKGSNQTPQLNRYREIVPKPGYRYIWGIFQHAPYSPKYIGFSTGYMEGRIKPWWDVYICLLSKVYKMLYTNYIINVFFQRLYLEWLSSAKTMAQFHPTVTDESILHTLGKCAIGYYLSSIHDVLGIVRHQWLSVYSLL